MQTKVFRHEGDFDASSRANRALRFIEDYSNSIGADLTLSYPDTKYYGPHCTFFDTANVTYTGATAIKAWMKQLFAPFDKLHYEGTRFLVVDESEGNGAKYTVVAEGMMYYWLKGDPEPILAPRIFVFSISEAETSEGFDGLQFSDVRLYWNTALVTSEAQRRAAMRASK
jgi:hypothetical protein